SLSASLTPDRALVFSTPARKPYAPPPLGREDSNIFAKLLISLAPPSLPTVISFPRIPQIPNVFHPLTSRRDNTPTPTTTQVAPAPGPTQCHLAKRAPGGSCSMPDNINGESYYTDHDEEQHTVPSNLIPVLFKKCSEHRSPNLPVVFAVEVGIVRLFEERSYVSEVTMVRGCGCINLDRPMHIQSFVGSRNHSFSFYESTDCGDEPFYQRFRQNYDLKVGKVARSVMITQGLLLPIPGDHE
ncbi:hypothetical protein BGZ92_003021, partial [Podila epicladia]